MAGLVSAYIQHFTYLGLLVVLILCGMGLPIPEDAALLAGGFLVHRGIIQYPITLVVALVGVVAGDNSLFFLGRRFGTGLVAYLGIGRPRSQRQIEWLKEFMRRHGHRAIFYARFVAGLRALVYLTAGSLGVSPLRFFLYDLAGAVISVPVVVTLGYLFGNELEAALRYIGGVEKVVWLVAALSLGVYAMRMLMFTRGREETQT
ncbi:MAG TPA: DedA family protein [Candidatus Binataceae bacterium]|nr:DedA family protein [Candidatus Binataceae bacterium]